MSRIDLWTRYGEQFKQGAFQLLWWGYVDSRSQFGSTTAEEVISDYIVRAIKERLTDPHTPEDFARFFAENEKPVSSPTRAGKQRRRIDIYVESSSPRERLAYFFEAKRLRRPTHSVTGYTGPDGMELFVDGEYAAEEVQGGMIGYIQSDSAGHWETLLDGAIRLDVRKKLSVREHLTRCVILPRLNDTWRTAHLRPNGSEFVLYHMFLDCT